MTRLLQGLARGTVLLNKVCKLADGVINRRIGGLGFTFAAKQLVKEGANGEY